MHNDTQEIIAYFDALAPCWDEISRPEPEKLAAIVCLAGTMQGKKILDVACGTGVLFPYLLKQEPASLTGIDISAEMIRQAARKFSAPNINLVAGDVLKWKDDGFDFIFLHNAYPHFADKQKLAGWVWEHLAPGGRFMLAHSDGRATINSRHSGEKTREVSQGLGPATEEVALWREFLAVDILADTSEFYLISGIKK